MLPHQAITGKSGPSGNQATPATPAENSSGTRLPHRETRKHERYAVEEELLDHSPAAHVRRPRVDYESHAVALDRSELGALLVAAGLGPPYEHALISLLALNGLR